MQRVVDMGAALAAGDPDLRGPEADPRPVACEHPDPLFRAQLHGQAEHLRVEARRRVEVGDFEHELVDAGEGYAHSRNSALRRRDRPLGTLLAMITWFRQKLEARQ